MENRYNSTLSRHGSGMWRLLRDGEFEEEDIWDVFKGKRNSDSNHELTPPPIQRSHSTSTVMKLIPKTGNEEKAIAVKHQSVPVNIPDWSNVSSRSRQNPNLDDDDDDGEEDDHNGGNSDDEDDDDGCYNRMVPPHEIIARRLARTQISSFSMFEGAGRTLKGRDLSKVRNAVLTKTGFLESF